MRTVLGATLRAKPRDWRLLSANIGSVRCLVLSDGSGLRAGQRVYVVLVAVVTGTVVRVNCAGDPVDDRARQALGRFLDQISSELAGGSGALGH